MHMPYGCAYVRVLRSDGVFRVRNASDFDVKLFHLHTYTHVYTYINGFAHIYVYAYVRVLRSDGVLVVRDASRFDVELSHLHIYTRV